MKLINRTPFAIQYYVYDATDTMAPLGFGVSRKNPGGSGGLKADSECDLNGSGGVQIEINVGDPPKGLYLPRTRAITHCVYTEVRQKSSGD